MSFPVSRSEEWRRHWPVAFAGFLGIALPTVAMTSSGIFITSLDEEFSWPRAEVAAGLTIASLISIPFSPMVGALIDRYGVRRIGLPGLAATTLAMAAFSLADGSLSQWMLLWFVYGVAALFVQPTLWAAAISNTFHAGRSTALSVAFSGMSMVLIAVPPLTEWLINNLGWRSAYAWLAVIFGLPPLVIAYFCLFDDRDRRTLSMKGRSAAPALTESALDGLTIAEAIRSVPLYRIAAASLITLLFGAAFLVHQFPILTEAGVSRQNAALLASLAGVASVTGKLMTGWLMERYDGGLIGSITNSMMAVGIFLLWEPFRSPLTIVIAMLVIGYSNGAKLQICAFLTSVYAGVRNYGKIFGVMVSMMAGAGGLGPLLGGIIYDQTGGYNTLIIIAIPCNLIAGLLLFRLGSYPQWARVQA